MRWGLFFQVAACLSVVGESRRFSPPKDWQYEVNNKTVPGKLNVHITPHTHDDTGWLMSVDQYYYSQVRYILDTVTDALEKNPWRKFNYVEMAFFSRWWEEQPEKIKAKVRKLVNNKQLEFLNGGWCMQDEAGPYFSEMVDQTTRGHQFILKEFGPEAAPRATWQIDPFGHTNTQAWLLAAEAGMPSLFWARMDHDDREARRHSKSLEYIWRGSRSRGSNAETFGSAIWGSDASGKGLYSCPLLHFEEYDSIGIQDNPNRHDYNVDEWVDNIVKMAQEQAQDYRSNHILWVCGFDFSHKNADTWFHNTDLIMHYVNQDGRINVLYSSPARYADAKNQDKSVSWPVREDDLMPLHEYPHVYWTGYFSSRVAFKRLVRTSWNFLNMARQLDFLSNVKTTESCEPSSPRVGSSWTDGLEGALSVAMHHDGISGTAKQAVNGDYASRIAEGQNVAEKGVSKALNGLLGISDKASTWSYCAGLNISVCDLTVDLAQKGGFAVAAWNPLGQAHKNAVFRFPVRLAHFVSSGEGCPFRVTGKTSDGETQDLPCQVLPLDKRTLELPLLYLNWFGLNKNEIHSALDDLRNPATHVLVFQADLPAMGYSLLAVEAQETQGNLRKVGERKEDDENTGEESATEGLSFENGVYRVTLDGRTKHVREIANLETGNACSLDISWGWYGSSPGGCSDFGCQQTPSGAYIFRPNSTEFYTPGPEQELETEIVTGELVTEIRQNVSPWVSHTIRLDKNARSIKVEFTVGPIPMDNPWLEDKTKAMMEIGKEIVVRYQTCLESNKVFYTDSNGLEMQRRVRDERPSSYPRTYSWKDEPISSNYYPVNAMISIQDEKTKRSFTVVTDSTQGGSSIHDGEVELMVHRRVFHDDLKGVEEPLNETMCGCNGKNDPTCYCHGLTVRGVHHLIFDSNEERAVNAMQQHAPVPFVSPLETLAKVGANWIQSALSSGLPENIHLMTISSNYAEHHGGKIFVRLHHKFAVDEHDELSKPVTIYLKDLFEARLTGTFVSAEETTLTGNLPVDQKYAYKWNYEDKEKATAENPTRVPYNAASSAVTLHPMEIRTFLVKMEVAPQLQEADEPNAGLVETAR